MGDGLERRGGGKLKSILESMTSSPFKGVLLGAGVTTERKYTNRALAKDIPEQII